MSGSVILREEIRNREFVSALTWPTQKLNKGAIFTVFLPEEGTYVGRNMVNEVETV